MVVCEINFELFILFVSLLGPQEEERIFYHWVSVRHDMYRNMNIKPNKNNEISISLLSGLGFVTVVW